MPFLRSVPKVLNTQIFVMGDVCTARRTVCQFLTFDLLAVVDKNQLYLLGPKRLTFLCHSKQ